MTRHLYPIFDRFKTQTYLNWHHPLFRVHQQQCSEMSKARHSSHGSNNTTVQAQKPPSIAACFLIRFDQKIGYTIVWKRSLPGCMRILSLCPPIRLLTRRRLTRRSRTRGRCRVQMLAFRLARGQAGSHVSSTAASLPPRVGHGLTTRFEDISFMTSSLV